MDKLDKNLIKKLLLLVGIIAFSMMSFNLLGFIYDSSFTSFDMLDVKGFYSAETFNANIVLIKAFGWTSSYILMHIEDYIFILTFYLWVAVVLFHLLKKNKSSFATVAIPLLAMIFDLVENIIIDIALTSEISVFWAGFAGYLTLFKFAFLLLAILLIAYQYLMKKKDAYHGLT